VAVEQAPLLDFDFDQFVSFQGFFDGCQQATAETLPTYHNHRLQVVATAP
jgi:hypothetical protein